MNVPLEEALGSAFPGCRKANGKVELITAQARDILNLRRLPAMLTVGQTAALLNCAEHEIPVLVSEGLLKPLGHPRPNAVKRFATVDVLDMAADPRALGKVCDVIFNHWRRRNHSEK